VHSKGDSVALASSQNENGIQQEPAENLGHHVSSEGQGAHLPVFDAFHELGLTGCDVADVAGVTPPTVSKWRSGKVRIPEERLVFMTLVLAHLLDDAKALDTFEAEWYAHNGAGNWCGAENFRIDAARAHLSMQDILNQQIAVANVRNGAKQFRKWWASGAATKLQEKRFSLALNGHANKELDILKARIKKK